MTDNTTLTVDSIWEKLPSEIHELTEEQCCELAGRIFCIWGPNRGSVNALLNAVHASGEGEASEFLAQLDSYSEEDFEADDDDGATMEDVLKLLTGDKDPE